MSCVQTSGPCHRLSISLLLGSVALTSMTAVTAVAANVAVAVGEPRIIMRESHYPVLLKLADGTIIADGAAKDGKEGDDGRMRKAVFSRDNGRTWCESPSTLVVSHDGTLCVLADGTVVAIGYHTRPVEGSPNEFTTARWISSDNWHTIAGPTPSRVKMADVVPSVDDGGKGYFGPLFHGRAVTLGDDAIVTTMYGKFSADRSFGDKSRSILVKSTDRGKTWQYVSTIASLHRIADAGLRKAWQDGFGEPTLALLPNGKMVCAMRTGTYAASQPMSAYSDLSRTIVKSGRYVVTTGETSRPIYMATSSDGGRTWSDPRPVPGAVGACPRLLVLENGVLALSYGRIRRPSQGAAIMFSNDGAETWTNPTYLPVGLSSGYTDMVPLGKDRLLCVYDSVTAWPPKIIQDWVAVVDVEVKPE